MSKGYFPRDTAHICQASYKPMSTQDNGNYFTNSAIMRTSTYSPDSIFISRTCSPSSLKPSELYSVIARVLVAKTYRHSFSSTGCCSAQAINVHIKAPPTPCPLHPLFP